MNIQELADRIARSANFTRPSFCYVSIYRRHRCYGGPEEGGWWYDRDEFTGGLPFVTREQAEAWLEHAKGEVEQINEAEAPARARAMSNLPDVETAYHPEGYIPNGWDDGGKLWITIEDVLGEHDNTKEPTPRYE